MKYKNLTILVLSLISYACGNKSQQNETVIDDNQTFIEQNAFDTASIPIWEEAAIIKETIPLPTSSSSQSHNPGYNDNMRGFDPASEDDMEDNGISRYMDNYDEEGWD